MQLNEQQFRCLRILMVIICLSFGLACAKPMVWVKPNSTQDDFNRDKYTCTLQSAQAFPVLIQQQTIVEGYTTPSQTSCNTYKGQTNCTTSPGIYQPPVTSNVDLNLKNRDDAFNLCMTVKGWTLREKK